MGETSGLDHRRFPRFLTRHPVEATTRDRSLRLRGILCELSQEGCRLQLDGYIPPGTPIEVRCNISGLALRLRGETAWADTLGGLVHGVAITGFVSEADAVFHRLYVNRLARGMPAFPEPG